jgi:DNA-binding GntR family transcriptional regulator
MADVRREHSEILQAIESRDPDRASRLAEFHVLNARRRMRDAFGSDVVPDVEAAHATADGSKSDRTS